MNTYFDEILSELKEDQFFQKFKFRKRDSSFIRKTKYGIQSIALEHWNYGHMSLIIRPIYEVRFDILCKWFEKFSFKTLRDQRDGAYKGFTSDMLGHQEKFEFLYQDYSVEHYNELIKLKKCIIVCSEIVFNEYSSLEKAYDREIVPLLDGDKALPNVGADWFFENLTLCRIVHPENYERLKNIQLKQAKDMFKDKEPNISIYYPRLDEILTYFENIQF